MSSSSKNPYLLITMGPTGSGKSSLIKTVCEHLKLPITKNKVLIDDLVVDNPYYRKKVKEFLDTKSHDELIKLFEKGHTGLQKTFNQFYFETRRQTYCYKSTQYYGTLLNNKDIQFLLFFYDQLQLLLLISYHLQIIYHRHDLLFVRQLYLK